MTNMTKAQQVVRLPRVTERSTEDQEKNNAYHFWVDGKSNKIEIRQAIEQLFGVKVLSVNTLNRKGRVRRRMTKRGQNFWQESNWKKAVVKLKAGDTIRVQ